MEGGFYVLLCHLCPVALALITVIACGKKAPPPKPAGAPPGASTAAPAAPGAAPLPPLPSAEAGATGTTGTTGTIGTTGATGTGEKDKEGGEQKEDENPENVKDEVDLDKLQSQHVSLIKTTETETKGASVMRRQPSTAKSAEKSVEDATQQTKEQLKTKESKENLTKGGSNEKTTNEAVTQGSKENLRAGTATQLEFPSTELKWEYEEGQNVLKIVNKTGKRQAFKMKTSNNAVYTVTPVMKFIPPGSTMNVVIVRKKGAFKDDEVVCQHVEAPDSGGNDVKEFWAKKPSSTETIIKQTFKKK